MDGYLKLCKDCKETFFERVTENGKCPDCYMGKYPMKLKIKLFLKKIKDRKKIKEEQRKRFFFPYK